MTSRKYETERSMGEKFRLGVNKVIDKVMIEDKNERNRMKSIEYINKNREKQTRKKRTLSLPQDPQKNL